MKIALVHDSLVQIGGAEKTLKVLADMFPDAPIYTSVYDKEKFQSWFEYSRIVCSSLQDKPNFLKKRYKFLLPFLPSAFESFDFTGFDLVISSSSSFAKGIVTPLHTKHINYCHTPTRFLWDSYHSYLRNHRLDPITRICVKRMLHKIRIWDRAAAERVDHFIANSQNVAERIEKFYRKESVIIHPPVDTEHIQEKSGHAEFFLIVSRLEKYKCVDTAIKAFNQIPTRKLIVIGEGSQLKHLQRIAQPNIQFLGYKPDNVIREYYQNCRAFIATAQDEDFGMTPIEAMAAGKPVLALKSGGFLETVIAGKTGEFYDENTPQSLLEGLIQLLEHSFESHEIRQHAEQFSVQSFQENIQSFIRSVMQ